MFRIIELRLDKTCLVWPDSECGESELSQIILPDADGTELIGSRVSIKSEKAAAGTGIERYVH